MNKFYDALKKAKMGVWIWNVTKNEIQWDEQLKSIFDLEEDKNVTTYKKFRERIHKQDIAEFESAIERSLATGVELSATYRILNNNSIKFIRTYGTPYEENGDVLFSGTCLEVSKSDYEAGTEASDACSVNRHFANAKKNIYRISKLLKEPITIDAPDPKEWYSTDYISNTMIRNISPDRTNHLTCEFLTQNATKDSHYHLHDKVITNLNCNPILVYIEGVLNELRRGESTIIPCGTMHKLVFNKKCYHRMTWLDFYVSNKTILYSTT